MPDRAGTTGAGPDEFERADRQPGLARETRAVQMSKPILLSMAMAGLLAACGSQETILPGERLDIRTGLTVGEEPLETEAPVARAFSLPQPVKVRPSSPSPIDTGAIGKTPGPTPITRPS